MHSRLPAFDRLRGIVMILMAGDHASEAFNANRVAGDGAYMPTSGDPLDVVQFLFRWTSHLCAPVFLFLAGTGLALGTARRIEAGWSGGKIDRDLVLRAVILFAVEAFFINWFWAPSVLALQVLFAIGASFLCMVLLRRFSNAVLLGFVAVAWLLPEWTRTGSLYTPNEPSSVLSGLLLNGAYFAVSFANQEGLMVAYPALPWCATMALGFVFGRWLIDRRARSPEDYTADTSRMLARAAGFCCVVFLVLRGANRFGNLGLLRADGSLLQWLHVSKYPPSLTFLALELGIAAVLSIALLRRDARRLPQKDDVVGGRDPLLVFGQTPFFFYVTHIALLEWGAHVLGMHRAAGLRETLVSGFVVLLVLYPACLAYRGWKRRHPRSVLRFF